MGAVADLVHTRKMERMESQEPASVEKYTRLVQELDEVLRREHILGAFREGETD